MSIMTKFEHGMERVLVPVANKLNSSAILQQFVMHLF